MMRATKHFLMGVVTGILTIMFAEVMLKYVAGDANVTVISGVQLSMTNELMVILIYGIGMVILGWLAEAIRKMLMGGKR